MFQGTGSNVGKSVLVAGLARALTRRGLRVRPFKPQNMSNNAAVTPDGGEIGRAQALQAMACGVAPSVHMNPVLLKPQSEQGSQIIVQGRVWGQRQARAYQQVKPLLMPAVMESFRTLQAEADIVLVEGAGSASEVNLRQNDIANMGFAEQASCPVILIGDIDRGGVIASLVGTQTVLPPADAARIRGFIVNRMRGDPTLFESGMEFITERTGWDPCGLVPHFSRMQELPSEDTGDLPSGCASFAHAMHGRGLFGELPGDRPPYGLQGECILRVAVPLMPMIANFDDLDALRAEPGLSIVYVPAGEVLPVCDLVILPGSKSTIADLAFLRAQGWDIDLRAHHRRGGHILGLCGGYQMLGRSIADPCGIEGPSIACEGLGFLELDTVITTGKTVRETTGQLLPDGGYVRGYEIHAGETTGSALSRPLIMMEDGRAEGAQSQDGRVSGSYLHGFFDKAEGRAAFLFRLGAGSAPFDNKKRVESALDALADHLESHIAVDRLLDIARKI
ncbi:cobyric acid synthase [Asaia krungthepensis]|uniref:Cobyric acid synthase n=1 Tax=Asaia krungthepensis NRIC 0535 TaxID=1307925 RepID=A0ABQ0Q1E7_9PROT|nr:cobyric acid synthase [Asaia krungthepensis]GBQ86741.1 cobyric acid synthase [Asaia krungthepensis NRIC 0535]